MHPNLTNLNIDHSKQTQISEFVEYVISTFGNDCYSIFIFGSAAEGRLRATSDVNLAVVVNQTSFEKMDQIRDQFRIKHATIQLKLLLLKADEISQFAHLFAVKFNDMNARHVNLYGPDIFNEYQPSRAATLNRLAQESLNLTLRLRERYLLTSLREEQLTPIVADITSAIRVIAANILKLEGQIFEHPKDAFQKLLSTLNWPDSDRLISNMSASREQKPLPPGEGTFTVIQLLNITEKISHVIQDMSKER